MHHLQRLSIQGIRSFNPDEPAEIQFFPLTIFLGPDDVGKTTIIDSLKYALTGNLPPNCDNEERFVHNVQYSKRSMICGQTRLKFIDSQNKSTDITRNLRLFSSKQNNQTTIRFIQDDANISQDNNPIGVNNEALEFWSFEISRVVLDYIIFCHQEQTNWPLSDGKVLKKRFDEIFGSISSVKKLEKIQKAQVDHLKLLENSYDLAVKKKEEIATNIAKSEEYSCKLRKLTEERNSLILKVKNKSSKLDSIIEKLNNRSNLNQKDCDLILEHFQIDIHSCEDEIKMKKSGINTNLISLKQDLDSFKNKKSNAILEWDICKKQLSETKLNLYEIENLSSSSVSHVHEQENIENLLENFSVLELQAESLKLQGELCGQIIELLNKVAVLEEQAKHCTIQIESLEKQFEAMQNELKQFERKKQIEIDQCENTIVKLTSLFESINSYVEKLNDSKFKSSQKYIEELDKQILKLEKEKKSIVSEISNMSQELLDYSSFHKREMEEINKLLKQFWQVAYQGKDVDYIMIMSDEEERSANDKQRTYNYRVVMVRNGQKMDMKGCCSAGEKVLASLVIRLALAVIFGQNFNVITLDEPTTNLDKANTFSFAKAVISLVKSQRKFQFIITSHDEEFIQFLDGDVGQQYYKIFKNERGYSSLVRKSIGNETEDTFPLSYQRDTLIDSKKRINEEENSLESTTKRTKRARSI